MTARQVIAEVIKTDGWNSADETALAVLDALAGHGYTVARRVKPTEMVGARVAWVPIHRGKK